MGDRHEETVVHARRCTTSAPSPPRSGPRLHVRTWEATTSQPLDISSPILTVLGLRPRPSPGAPPKPEKEIRDERRRGREPAWRLLCTRSPSSSSTKPETGSTWPTLPGYHTTRRGHGKPPPSQAQGQHSEHILRATTHILYACASHRAQRAQYTSAPRPPTARSEYTNWLGWVVPQLCRFLHSPLQKGAPPPGEGSTRVL